MTTVSLTKINPDAAEAVVRGIEWLDANLDWDWRTQVRANLERLDLKSLCNCVLGVLYGWYDTAMDEHPELRYDYDEDAYPAIAVGFDANPNEFEPDHTSYGYAELTEAWKAALS